MDIRLDEGDVTDSTVGRYIVYIFGFFVAILVIAFSIWHTQRKRHLMSVRNRILQLRAECRPENIIKMEIGKSLKPIKYKPSADNADNCVICCDDFKKGHPLTSTECNHLFHTECLWKWIDTKLAQTMQAL